MSSIPLPSLNVACRVLVCAIAALALRTGTAATDLGTDADGVQRLTLVAGSYFFRPDHIVVQAGRPLEISLTLEPGLIPHRFVLEGPDGRRLADVALGTEARTVRLTLNAGDYVFYCPNQLLHFRSHRERGMAGVLQVRE